MAEAGPTEQRLLVHVDFREKGNAASFGMTGFSGPGIFGTWTTGAMSEITLLPPPSAGALSLYIEFFPLVNERCPAQRVCIDADDHRVFDQLVSKALDVRLALPDVFRGREQIKLRLVHPEPPPHPQGLAIHVGRISLLEGEPKRGVSSGTPVFRIEPVGQLANQMIQFMVAMKAADLVPCCEIANVFLPEWGICVPDKDNGGAVWRYANQNYVNFEDIRAKFAAGECGVVRYVGNGCRLENFLPRERYRAVFRSDVNDYRRFDDDSLVINVRAGEIVQAFNPYYTLVPPAYYKDLIRETGRRPVFLGQLDRNAYTDLLRENFPEAEFVPSQGGLKDFLSLQSAKHLVVGVSTFSWLAAWLSEAETIFMPLTGVLHPMNEIGIALAPLEDPRYRFDLFPSNFAVPLDMMEFAFSALQGRWRRVSSLYLQNLIQGFPRIERRIESFLPLFDEAFYLTTFPQAAAAVAAGEVESAEAHYRREGFWHRWPACKFDARWYVLAYPLAGWEISQGDFVNAEHHYVVTGRARGYLPYEGALL